MATRRRKPTSTGSNVTFKGADNDRIRRVIVDGRKFPLGVPVRNVSKETVARLEALEGHEFEIETPTAKTTTKQQ